MKATGPQSPIWLKRKQNKIAHKSLLWTIIHQKIDHLAEMDKFIKKYNLPDWNMKKEKTELTNY